MKRTAYRRRRRCDDQIQQPPRAARARAPSSAIGKLEAHRRLLPCAGSGGAPARAASRRRSTARCARRRRGAARARARRARPRRARRSAHAACGCSCPRAAGAPSRGRPATGRRRRAAPARAGRGPRPRSRGGGCSSRSSGVRQSRGPRKSDTTTTSPRWRASWPARASASPRSVAPGAVRLGLRAQREQQPEQPAGGPAAAQRDARSRAPNVSTPSRLPCRVATCPTASAAPSATSALRRSAVPKLIEGEHVEQQPGRQRPLGHLHAHVRLARARGHGPVDLAHVVAELVRAHLRELGAVPERRRRGARRTRGCRCGAGRSGRAPAGSRPASGPGPGAPAPVRRG